MIGANLGTLTSILTKVGGAAGVKSFVRQAAGGIIQQFRGSWGGRAGHAARSAAKAAGLGAAFGAGSEALEGFVPFGVSGLEEAVGLGQRKRRRMNVLNPRALKRSLRRVEGFRRFATRSGLFRRVTRIAPKKHRFGKR